MILKIWYWEGGKLLCDVYGENEHNGYVPENIAVHVRKPYSLKEYIASYVRYHKVRLFEEEEN